MAKRGQKPVNGDTPDQQAAPVPQTNGRVFISWSGVVSKKVAEALNWWLPEVIEGIEPWISTQNITAGIRWGSEINRQLEHSNFGIVCLTKDNLQAPWILFEAGALAKAVDSSRVVPYLFGVPGSDVIPPLSQFNHVIADREGTYGLLRSVNAQYGGKYEEDRLERKFEKYWPDLEEKLAAIPKDSGKSTHRKDRELIEELLEIARKQSPTLEEIGYVLDHRNHELEQLFKRTFINVTHQFPPSGYDLVEYIGCLSLADCKMGIGTLYCYWLSLEERINELHGSDDPEDAITDPVEQYEQLYQDIRRELERRGLVQRMTPISRDSPPPRPR